MLMKILGLIPVKNFFLLMTTLYFSHSSYALVTNCGSYSLAGTPYVYSTMVYTPLEATYGDTLRLATSLLEPYVTSGTDYGAVDPAGGSASHDLAAYLGSTFTIESEGSVGYFSGAVYFPMITSDCSGSFSFTPPTANVTITPNIVVSGATVTITWSSDNADRCEFEGDDLPLSGTHIISATPSDAGTYLITCENEWGVVSASATLLVY